MLSDNEVADLLAEIAQLRPDDNFTPQPESEKHPSYHCSFLDTSEEYKRKTSDILRAKFQPLITKYMPDFVILNANFYVKPLNTGMIPIHQNWPMIDLNDTTVTLWCPLQDVDVKNGVLHIIPGSHKIIPHVEGINVPAYFTHFREALVEKYLQPVPMKAGDAIIFDDGLLHWSPDNHSNQPRIAIQILCIPKDTTPFLYFYDPEHPDRFEKIEAEPEFWLSQGAKDIRTRQPEWKSLGFVPNHNRFITEKEFADLLSRGNEIRQKIYFPTEE